MIFKPVMCYDLLKTESGIMQVVIAEVSINRRSSTEGYVWAEVISANITYRTVTAWYPRFYGYSISYKTWIITFQCKTVYIILYSNDLTVFNDTINSQNIRLRVNAIALKVKDFTDCCIECCTRFIIHKIS